MTRVCSGLRHYAFYRQQGGVKFHFHCFFLQVKRFVAAKTDGLLSKRNGLQFYAQKITGSVSQILNRMFFDAPGAYTEASLLYRWADHRERVCLQMAEADRARRT